MSNLLNSGLNQTLQGLTNQASKGVVNAIQNASAQTGVDFSYLLQQAKVESSFDPNAKAKGSSATGLYQFIESTWLDMVERHGDKYGIQTEGKSRKEILNLRRDPEISSQMAAEFARENEEFLNANWGGDVGSTELYLAHFMGAGGAASFLKAQDESPLQIAADIFPKAARANRNVFYDSRTGQPRTISEVYAFFDQKFQIEDQGSPAPSPSLVRQKPEKIIPPEYEPKNSSVFTNSLYVSDAGERSPVVQSYNRMPIANLVSSPVELMILSELSTPGFDKNLESTRHNS
jgi:hypothetical protein